MQDRVDIASVAALIGDPSRALMLCALMDGRARTATELAQLARVSPSTASLHLTRLLEGKLLAVEAQGRHRYYRLRDPAVSAALESLMVLTAARPEPPRALSPAERALREARMCYDHLAGARGVRLTRAMTERGLLAHEDGELWLTESGERQLQDFGIDLAALRRRRRAFVRGCLDWSERQIHLAGAVGAALTQRLLDLRWLRRAHSGRALVVTEAGRRGLRSVFRVS